MFTDIKIRLERAGHCQKCENYKRSTKQCMMCGCLVSLKIMIAEESCPIKKWKQVEPGTDLASKIASTAHKLIYGVKSNIK